MSSAFHCCQIQIGQSVKIFVRLALLQNQFCFHFFEKKSIFFYKRDENILIKLSLDATCYQFFSEIKFRLRTEIAFSSLANLLLLFQRFVFYYFLKILSSISITTKQISFSFPSMLCIN